jgi:acetyl esterase/lipase
MENGSAQAHMLNLLFTVALRLYEMGLILGHVLSKHGIRSIFRDQSAVDEGRTGFILQAPKLVSQLTLIQFTQQYPQLADLDKVGIEERRRIFTEIEATLPPRTLPQDVQEDSLTVESFTIAARDGHEIPVRSYVPPSTASSPARPLLVYLHAGGFLFGDLESGDMNCRILSSRLRISVLNVGYRLAPKWKFPHGLNDSYDATVWVSLRRDPPIAFPCHC